MTQFDVEKGNFKLGSVFIKLFLLELARAYVKYCIWFDVEKVYLLKRPKSSIFGFKQTLMNLLNNLEPQNEVSLHVSSWEI